MWSAVVAERLGIIGHARGSSRGSTQTLDDARAHGAPRAERPVLQLVRPPRPARSSPTWPPTATPLTPILSSVDNGWLADRPADRGRAASRSCRRAGAGALRLHGLRLLLPAGRQPDPVPLRARHRRGAVLLRHDRQREPDRDLHRDRQGRDPAQGVLRRLAAVPDTCDWSWQETKPVGVHAHATSASTVFEGAYPYDGMRVVAGLGRQHVRGADARAVRARGALGAGSWASTTR